MKIVYVGTIIIILFLIPSLYLHIIIIPLTLSRILLALLWTSSSIYVHNNNKNKWNFLPSRLKARPRAKRRNHPPSDVQRDQRDWWCNTIILLFKIFSSILYGLSSSLSALTQTRMCLVTNRRPKYYNTVLTVYYCRGVSGHYCHVALIICFIITFIIFARRSWWRRN